MEMKTDNGGQNMDKKLVTTAELAPGQNASGVLAYGTAAVLE